MKRSIAALAVVLMLLCGCGKQPEPLPPEPVPEEPVQVELPAEEEKEKKNGLIREGENLIYYVEDEAQVFAPGVQEIEGKAYLILEDGSICSLQKQLYEFRYYLEEDSSLRRFEEGFAELPEGIYRRMYFYSFIARRCGNRVKEYA